MSSCAGTAEELRLASGREVVGDAYYPSLPLTLAAPAASRAVASAVLLGVCDDLGAASDRRDRGDPPNDKSPPRRTGFSPILGREDDAKIAAVPQITSSCEYHSGVEIRSTRNITVVNGRTVAPMASSPSFGVIPSPLRAKLNNRKPLPFENFFPSKLYKMLKEAEAKDHSGTVAWQPHGRAFLIKDKVRFMTQLAPLYFKATKYRSFQRQCGLWGFSRIICGPDKGTWWHESFVRGHPEKLASIVRTPLKTQTPSIQYVPNFHENYADGRSEIPVDVGSFPVSSNLSHNANAGRGEIEKNVELILVARALSAPRTTLSSRQSCTGKDVSCHSSFARPLKLDTLTLKPCPSPINLGRDSEEIDEFSAFIDKTIHQLP